MSKIFFSRINHLKDERVALDFRNSLIFYLDRLVMESGLLHKMLLLQDTRKLFYKLFK